MQLGSRLWKQRELSVCRPQLLHVLLGSLFLQLDLLCAVSSIRMTESLYSVSFH